jgi:hypothetical protein
MLMEISKNEQTATGMVDKRCSIALSRQVTFDRRPRLPHSPTMQSPSRPFPSRLLHSLHHPIAVSGRVARHFFTSSTTSFSSYPILLSHAVLAVVSVRLSSSSPSPLPPTLPPSLASTRTTPTACEKYWFLDAVPRTCCSCTAPNICFQLVLIHQL